MLVSIYLERAMSETKTLVTQAPAANTLAKEQQEHAAGEAMEVSNTMLPCDIQQKEPQND